MNDFVISMISIFVSFLLGNLIFFILLRGFLVPYFKAKGKGGILLRVHRVGEARAVWRCALKDPSGIYKYKIGTQEHIFTPVDDSIFRCLRVSMADVKEEDTAPYIFKKYVPVEITEVKEDEKGEKVSTTRVEYRVFQAYDDSPILENMFKWALMRPKRSLGGMNLDAKTILIILIALGGIIYLVMSMSGGSII